MKATLYLDGENLVVMAAPAANGGHARWLVEPSDEQYAALRKRFDQHEYLIDVGKAKEV